jgi:hypothetical protein
MITIRNLKPDYKMVLVMLVLFLSVLMGGMSFGHGPKGHSEVFTSLQALKKALGMYDRLIESGKLKESWETDLNTIQIERSLAKNEKEFIVKFIRAKGEKKTLFIFFSGKGEYKGSNFTGK